MKTAIKTTANIILFSTFLSLSATSFASDDYDQAEMVTEGDIIVDMFLARPLGVLGSAGGLVLQGFGLLFSVPGENFAETGEVLVEEPLNYTFNRPLGHFEDYE